MLCRSFNRAIIYQRIFKNTTILFGRCMKKTEGCVMERILNLVKYEEMMNEFDHAYIFISSMSSRQKRDMCACFLKLGYGIREESSISMHVVNLSDDSKFFANISFLVWFFDIMSYISIYKEEKCGELGNRERERTHVKKEFKLKTYRDYSRLSRQTMSAIYNRVFLNK